LRSISAPRATPTTWWADGNADARTRTLGWLKTVGLLHRDAPPRLGPAELDVRLRLGGLQPGPLPPMDAATG